MTNNEFRQILQERLEDITLVLDKKAREYAREDRLHNFKRAGEMMGCAPERALIGMWAKHVVSILDLVDDLEMGKVASEEMWEEKIGDAINYLILLEALVKERIRGFQKKTRKDIPKYVWYATTPSETLSKEK